MAASENVSKPILPKKRPVNDADDCELEEYRKPKTVVPKYPPPKIRTGVHFVRDFPPGCGIKEESLDVKVETNTLKNVSNFGTVKVESFEPEEEADSLKITSERRNPLKILDNVDFKHSRVTSHGKVKEKLSFEDNNKLKSLKPEGLGRNNPCLAPRPPGKVKFWDPSEDRKPKVTTTVTRVVSQPSENKKLRSIKPEELTKEGDAHKPMVTPTVVSRFSENDNLRSLKTKEVGRNNPSFVSKPTGKVKFYDPTRDDDAEKPKVTTTVTLVSKPKEMGRSSPSFGSKPAGKVKVWDPNSPKEVDAQKSKDNAIVPSSKDEIRREKIKEAMRIFDDFHGELYQMNKSRPKEEKIAHWRVSLEAAKKVQQKLKWMDAKKTLGPICGVHIGDKFKYRAQLKMIGLHCQMQSGIDYTMIGGRNLAISIVDANRYSNQRQSCDELYYSGQGGITFLGNKPQTQHEDQKLERGNLALKNSMIEKTPVRVIRKLQGFGSEEAFVYDGLYLVEDFTKKKGEQGIMVFMFKLRRMPGQPLLHQMLNGSGCK